MCLVNISHCTVPDCITFPMSPFLFVIDLNDSLFKPKWITFQENHFQNILMDTIDFNKLQGDLNFAFDQR